MREDARFLSKKVNRFIINLEKVNYIELDVKGVPAGLHMVEEVLPQTLLNKLLRELKILQKLQNSLHFLPLLFLLLDVAQSILFLLMYLANPPMVEYFLHRETGVDIDDHHPPNEVSKVLREKLALGELVFPYYYLVVKTLHVLRLERNESVSEKVEQYTQRPDV